MTDQNYDFTSKSQISRFLEARGIRLSKKLGQHFLTDNNVKRNIINAAGISNDDIVLEIGPGIGIMSVPLAKKCRRLILVEFDRRFEPVLNEMAARYKNIDILFADALSPDMKRALPKKVRPNKLVSNLPYNIAATLILKYLEELDFIEDYTVMIQREVAERITASPGSKDYGAFTVKVGYMAGVKKHFNVSRNVFFPPPNVESAVVGLKRREGIDAAEKEGLFRLVEAAFAQRRKKFVNSTADTLPIDKSILLKALDDLGLDSGIRAEALSLKDFKNIWRKIEANSGDCREAFGLSQ